MTLVDSNILIDILAHDPNWEAWSIDAMHRRSSVGDLIINEIVYAEISARYESRAVMDDAIAELGIRLTRTPIDALHRAGRVFSAYRKSGGSRSTLLPDFFIGAHADVAGLTILTRDTRRYETYFPNVARVAP